MLTNLQRLLFQSLMLMFGQSSCSQTLTFIPKSLPKRSAAIITQLKERQKTRNGLQTTGSSWGAYISIRLLECDFLLDNRNRVAAKPVLDQINAMPAGSSLKALLRVDSGQKSVPRRFGSRHR